MQAILDLKGDDVSKFGRLKIDGTRLIIEFLPLSESKEDLHAAAVRRNRFNFAISFFLSSYIADKITYGSSVNSLELHNKQDKSFSVFLNFKEEVDENLLKLIFGGEVLPKDILYSVLPWESFERSNEKREEQKEGTTDPVSDPLQPTDEEKKLKETKEDNINDEIKEATTQIQCLDYPPAESKLSSAEVSVKRKSTDLSHESTEIQIQEPINDNDAELIQTIEAHIATLSKAKKVIAQIKENDALTFVQVNSLAAIEALQSGSNTTENSTFNGEGETDKFAEFQAFFENTFKPKNKEMEVKVEQIEQLEHDRDLAKSAMFEKEQEPQKKSSLFNIVDDSMVLLEANMADDQPILMYSNFIDQQTIRIKMKVDGHPDQNIYDDICLIDENEERNSYLLSRKLATFLTEQAVFRSELTKKKWQDFLGLSADNSVNKNEIRVETKSIVGGLLSSFKNYYSIASTAGQRLFSKTPAEIELAEKNPTPPAPTKTSSFRLSRTEEQ